MRRLISSIGSVRFRDEVGEIEYFGQPIVMLTRAAIRIMRDELMTVRGATGRVIILSAGDVSGREEGKALLAQAKAHGIESPQSLPSAILTAVEETNMGFGKIRIDNINLGTGTFKILVSNSFEVDPSRISQKPTCAFILSYLKGLFSELIGRDLEGEEVECRSKGDPRCMFNLAVGAQAEPAKDKSEIGGAS